MERKKVIVELGIDILLDIAAFTLYLLLSCELSLRWEMLSHRWFFWYAVAVTLFCQLLSLMSLS